MRVFSPTSAGGSLGFSPSQGLCTSILVRASANLLPRACPPDRLLDPASRASESRSINVALDHEGRAPLSGFLHLNIPGIRPIREPELMDSPDASPRVTVQFE